MIYIFIAASYFPWLTLRPLPPNGWAAELKWAVWVLASLGILYQQLFHEQYKWLETMFYLVMGICPSLAILSMVSVLSVSTRFTLQNFNIPSSRSVPRENLLNVLVRIRFKL